MVNNLSDRLQAIADFVSPGLVLADIGCDHAQLPIALVSSGKTPSAIATDVNEGPLEIAAKNVREAGLSDRIEIRLSDGFAKIRPGEARSAVIAGMGGRLICRILREGMEVLQLLNELILAPQSDVGMVRSTAGALGFMILLEAMVKEDGKYYPVIRMTPGMQLPLSRTEILFGPQLITRQDPVLHSFLLEQQENCRVILAEMDMGGLAPDDARRMEVQTYLAEIGNALRFYV